MRLVRKQRKQRKQRLAVDDGAGLLQGLMQEHKGLDEPRSCDVGEIGGGHASR